MNILIPDSWLKEFLKTKATPKKIAEYLSLCSQSVEKITKLDDDWVYEIEVTTNRPDCLSVYGIARELAAILPRFGIKTKLSFPSSLRVKRSNLVSSEIATAASGVLAMTNKLEVKIENPSLCPRFTAIIFDNVKIKPSPKIIQDRLEKSGIRGLNNVVDISNYLMLELGQPMHAFDYDKIKGAKMTLRQAQGKEKVTTLDGQTRMLPAGTIIIEDGKGRIIDLCGIMGAENSAVEGNTKRVLLFVQTYDPMKIRRACQLLGFQTEAASRFEKGVDPEGVIVAIKKAVEMFEKNCEAKVASKVIDIYPNPPKEKTIKLDLNLVNNIIGVEIPKNEIDDILKSLGFSIIYYPPSIIQCTVPHWRYNDISIPEDLIEEIARIYGYYNLPSTPLAGTIKATSEQRFFWEEKIKNALKYWGLTEVTSYSMISEELLSHIGLDPQNYLQIANPLTSDLVFMRPSLIPSILQIIMENQANFPDVRIFEIANIYIPQGEKNLPEEIPILTAAQPGNRFFEAKGILEALFEDLGIKDYKFAPSASRIEIFNPKKMAEILIGGKPAGFLGEIEERVTQRFEIVSSVTLFELEIDPSIKSATHLKKYTPIPIFPRIIEDLAFVTAEKIETAKIIEKIKSISKLIVEVKLLDSYNNTQTFRITYQSPVKTLTSKEVGKIREKITKAVREKFGANLKS